MFYETTLIKVNKHLHVSGVPSLRHYSKTKQTDLQEDKKMYRIHERYFYASSMKGCNG